MLMTTLPSLSIGSHRVRYSIIQGGMGIRISGAHLAAAVANAGGIGVISAVGLGMSSPYFNPDEQNPKQRREQFFEANRLALIDELKQARSLSPDGINRWLDEASFFLRKSKKKVMGTQEWV